MNRSERGFSSLEFTVSTLISVPLVLLIVQVVTSLHILLIKAQKDKEKTTASIALYRAVERSTADLDTHPFFLPPRSHKGHITYFDGSILTHNRLGANGTGFTSTALRFSETVRLETDTTGARGCMAFQERGRLLSGSPIRSVLILGADGFSETIAEFSRDPDPACYKIQLRPPTRSMITAIPDKTHILLARYAIPVRWIQTYVRDAKGMLRVLRHAGEHVYLNQPIAKGVPPFALRVQSGVVPGTFSLRLNTEKHQELAFIHRVPRTDFRHILWSLP